MRAAEPVPHAITLIDDEPATESVSGAVLLDDTAALARRHVVMSEAQARAVALWTAATYAIDALGCMPILLVTAATMRAGKTTLINRYSRRWCRGRSPHRA